jgi:hypothetical protein
MLFGYAMIALACQTQLLAQELQRLLLEQAKVMSSSFGKDF